MYYLFRPWLFYLNIYLKLRGILQFWNKKFSTCVGMSFRKWLMFKESNGSAVFFVVWHSKRH